jgi:hypothetical protein
VHNFSISYTCGWFKAVCKSWTGVYLGNLQWCREPCLAGAATLRDRCRSLISMRDKHKSLQIWSVPYGGLVREWIRVGVTLRLAVYCQSVHLGAKHFETHDQYFFQLNICGYNPYVTSSLTRGWVCRLQLLLTLANTVILGSEPRETHDHILLSQIRDSPDLEGQVHVFMSPRNRVARLYPRHWIPFSSSPTTGRATVEVFEPASTRVTDCYDGDTGRTQNVSSIIAFSLGAEKCPRGVP